MLRNAAGRAAWPALAFACLLISSCSSIPAKGCDPRPLSTLCLPGFPDADGWYGGDGAYSIALDDGRVLWLFGDTFVSDREGRRDRIGMKAVLGTTLAVSTCTPDAGFRIRYYLKRKNGEFISSFGDGEWVWPQDPFIVDRTLYVPLLSVRANPEIEGPFKFEIAGHRIARIRDCSGPDPNQWMIDYMDLTAGISKEIKAFATTSVVYRGYVYFYPLIGAQEGGSAVLGNILARIPAERLDAPAQAIEYLNSDGKWTKTLEPLKAKVVFDAAVSEMSVRYHPGEGKWVAIYMSIHNHGDRILYRTAEALEGPWTEPQVLIGSIPEVDPDGPRYDRNNFCYAGKEHLQYAEGRNWVVTYVCNSYEDDHNGSSFIRNNLFLYRPVVRRVRP